MDWTGLLILVVLRVLPWIFVAVGAWLLFSAWRFLSGAERVRGRVRAVRTSTARAQSGGGVTTTFRPIFTYTAPDGTEREAETATFSTTFDFAQGAEMDILVNPAEPGTARLPGAGNYALGGALLGIGLLFAIVGLLAPLPG